MTKEKVSAACAALGVLLLVASGVMSSNWNPAIPALSGFALLVVSHVLTPCQDQITRFWRHRVLRQPAGK